MRFGVIASFGIFSAVAIELFLLVSNTRVLLSQRIVHPGEHFIAGEWGDLGKSGQASLACTYFTGRGQTLNVYWYSMDNFMGKDQCPFLFRP
jgi:hypothetical protein